MSLPFSLHSIIYVHVEKQNGMPACGATFFFQIDYSNRLDIILYDEMATAKSFLHIHVHDWHHSCFC